MPFFHQFRRQRDDRSLTDQASIHVEVELRTRRDGGNMTALPDRHNVLREHPRYGIAAAATKYGYSESMTRIIASKYGWQRAPLLYDQEAILKDYLSGMPLVSIVEKHGCDRSYATKLATRRGRVRDPKFDKINKRGPRGPHNKKPQR